MEKREEIDEVAALKKRVRQLEAFVADSAGGSSLERATSKWLAERAGVEDLEEFKKKRVEPSTRGGHSQNQESRRSGALPKAPNEPAKL